MRAIARTGIVVLPKDHAEIRRYSSRTIAGRSRLGRRRVGQPVQHLRFDWTFDGVILGTMSEVDGNHEALNNPVLGAAGATCPGTGFSNRGLEEESLVVKTKLANSGPARGRLNPRSRSRSHPEVSTAGGV